MSRPNRHTAARDPHAAALRAAAVAPAPLVHRPRIMLPDVGALVLRAVLFVVVAVRVDDIAAFLQGII